MAIVNQLNAQPATTQSPQQAQPQGQKNLKPKASEEMVVTMQKEDKPSYISNKYVSGVIIVFLLLIGLASGVYLVQNQQIFRSKAGAGWNIDSTNLSFCTDDECILPSDLLYCPTVEGFELTTGSCTSPDAIEVLCSQGMSGYLYHCPSQSGGNCYLNKKYIGTYTTGQSVNVVALANQAKCGTVQIEFNSDTNSNISGGCGMIVLQDSRCVE